MQSSESEAGRKPLYDEQNMVGRFYDASDFSSQRVADSVCVCVFGKVTTVEVAKEFEFHRAPSPPPAQIEFQPRPKAFKSFVC